MTKRTSQAIGLALMVATTVISSGVAHADSVTYGLTRFTANGVVNPESQFTVEVRDFDTNNNALTGQASFLVRNVGLIASSITEVYFEDGTLLGIATVNESTGVQYSQGGNPANVPSGNSLNPAFSATQNFLATADSGQGGQSAHGVNPGEWVEIIFNLINGYDYSDVITAIQSGFDYTENGGPRPDPSLRIALHATSIGNAGESESFLMGPQNIPLPTPLGMGAIGLLGVVLSGRRRRDAAI